MQRFNELAKEELKGWKPFDIIWLVLASVIITTITLLTTDTETFGQSHPTLSMGVVKACVVCSIVAAIIGVINVVLGGKGKLSNYFFGVISALLMIYSPPPAERTRGSSATPWSPRISWAPLPGPAWGPAL